MASETDTAASSTITVTAIVTAPTPISTELVTSIVTATTTAPALTSTDLETSTLTETSTSPPTSNSTPTPPIRTDPSNVSDNYGSSSWRPGAGIGVVIGFVAIFVIAGVVFWFWRRGRLRKRRERGREEVVEEEEGVREMGVVYR